MTYDGWSEYNKIFKVFQTPGFDEYKKNMQSLNAAFNSPAVAAYRKNMQWINKSFQKPAYQSLVGQLDHFTNWNRDFKNLSRNINYWNKSLNLSLMNGYSDTFSKSISDIFKNNYFRDLLVEDLNVIEEVIDEHLPQVAKEGRSDLNASMRDTTRMSDVELKKVIKETIQEAFLEFESTKTSKASKTSTDKLREFLSAVVTGLLLEFTIDKVYWILANIIFPIIIAIVLNNHNVDVVQQISEKISQNATVSEVKRAFKKNPEVAYPMGDLAFVRSEILLRTRPTKKANLVSADPIPRNTVVIPLNKQGNWILVEVETSEESYIGWVQESKVVKFKLEK